MKRIQIVRTHCFFTFQAFRKSEYTEDVREMLWCLMTAFMRTGRCDGQMGGLTELRALLAAQKFAECQPKLLKHSNQPLLNIAHRENNHIHSENVCWFW